MTTLRPTICLGLRRLRDAGHDGARLGFADIDFQVEEFVGAFDRLGRKHLADAQIDFGEVVDLDLLGLGRMLVSLGLLFTAQ